MFSLRSLGRVMALLGAMVSVGVAMSYADAPRMAPADVKVYSHNKKFYAVSRVKEQKTAVFRVGAAKKPEWEMAGYSPVLFLSDDGKHLVEGYAGGNILDANVKGTDALLTFFAGPERVGTATVAEVFPQWKMLPSTTSGRVWGNFWGFEGPNRFVLLDNDDKKIVFDVRTGKLIAS